MIKSVSGIARSSSVYAFNEGFNAKKNTVAAGNTGFMCTHLNDLAIPGYINSILDFCLTSNAHEKLGLSFKDIWNMDVWMFTKIRKILKEHRPKEDAVLKELMRETSSHHSK